ncbi:exosortase F system-associated protein [Flavobacterium album]|uniref:Exosortase F system-associated protein n=2 Tax=Flavobacterium album TaxID=2175091 RepID=A0A2S1QXJ0_9FLAO|nr:exosortase F system-associated protein [Flavobacterium album]AWH85059.1 exosortase F system-associated protein [Flavobacterium album]
MRLNIKDISGIIVLLVLLVLVRVFEEKLFYDPLLAFFRKEDKELPEYDSMQLFFGLAFRYGLNMLFSLGIIWLAFKDKSVMKLTTVLYAVFFVLLTAVLFISLNTEKPSLLLIFYVRRFLIQPLFLILFLPAFYYQAHINKKPDAGDATGFKNDM